MPYTLAMFFVWGLAMAVVGGVVGWLLRSLRGRSRLAAARADDEELQRLRAERSDLDAAVAERDRLRMELADIRGRTAGDSGFVEAPPPDLEAARDVFGRDVVLDDLTMIDGIGADVVELCSGIGVTTWRDLAHTDVSMLSLMLADGGSRFRNHDPAGWPGQAALLADGRWEEFVALQGGDGD